MASHPEVTSIQTRGSIKAKLSDMANGVDVQEVRLNFNTAHELMSHRNLKMALSYKHLAPKYKAGQII